MSASLSIVAETSGAFVGFVARGLATRSAEAAFVGLPGGVTFAVVRFMTSIVATSMPVVPVPATPL